MGEPPSSNKLPSNAEDDDPGPVDNGPGNEEDTAHEGRQHEEAIQSDVEESRKPLSVGRWNGDGGTTT